MAANRPLTGIRIIEIEGIGPGPFCGMYLADLGAEVTVIARSEMTQLGKNPITRRGKTLEVVDLKSDAGRDRVLELSKDAHGLFEGLRPGVMERLGLGPAALAAVNPALVYGRLTGWGQSGPLSQAAGHDINYIALTGALHYSGAADTPPAAPPTLLGDIAGGALYLASGMIASIMRAKETGEGTVIDAAIVDGTAHMMNLLLDVRAAGGLPDSRGESFLDGAPWYRTYACADGQAISIGPLEPQFFTELCQRLELEAHQSLDPAGWPALEQALEDKFLEKPRDEWCEILEGTDACFAPVLTPSEAARHPHNVARGIFTDNSGRLEAAPAPRFSPLKHKD